MNMTLIDDSFSFDGQTIERRALGWAEKAFVYLSTTLFERGNDVTVINRCQYQTRFDGIPWLPFNTPRLHENDIVIAYSEPQLLLEYDDNSFQPSICL